LRSNCFVYAFHSDENTKNRQKYSCEFHLFAFFKLICEKDYLYNLQKNGETVNTINN
jgi:hypothetical protein